MWTTKISPRLGTRATYIFARATEHMWITNWTKPRVFARGYNKIYIISEFGMKIPRRRVVSRLASPPSVYIFCYARAKLFVQRNDLTAAYMWRGNAAGRTQQTETGDITSLNLISKFYFIHIWSIRTAAAYVWHMRLCFENTQTYTFCNSQVHTFGANTYGSKEVC